MSAGKSATIKLEEIEAKKFEAESQAYAQRMLKPVFGPALPKPFATPKTKFVKPQLPIYQTKSSVKAGIGGGYTSPQQPSGLSTALNIVSSVAAVAAPFTGGATAPIAAGAKLVDGLFKMFT